MWHSLLNDYDSTDQFKNSVSVSIAFPLPWDITFTAGSHGGESFDNRDAAHWRKTGGAAATMGFEANNGKVLYPTSCAGMQGVLLFNSLGLYRNFEDEDAGFIGDGWAEANAFLLRVYVDYHIARGLIDYIYTYSRIGKKIEGPVSAVTIQFDLMSLKQHTVSSRDQLGYRIVRFVV